MRHQKQSCFGTVLEVEEKVDDFRTRRGIEIARRLIRKKYARFWRQCSGQSHALLLSAGELTWIVIKSVPQADSIELQPSAVECFGDVCEFEGQRDIFERGHRRNEMKRLKYDAHSSAPESRQCILIEVCDVYP